MKNGHKEVIKIKANLCTNQLDLIKQLALEGICLAVLPFFMVKQEIKQKKLMICLPNYQIPPNDFYAIYPEREFKQAKVKAFVDASKIYFDQYK